MVTLRALASLEMLLSAGIRCPRSKLQTDDGSSFASEASCFWLYPLCIRIDLRFWGKPGVMVGLYLGYLAGVLGLVLSLDTIIVVSLATISWFSGDILPRLRRILWAIGPDPLDSVDRPIR